MHTKNAEIQRKFERTQLKPNIQCLPVSVFSYVQYIQVFQVNGGSITLLDLFP